MHTYRSSRALPEPDGQVGQSPYWRRSTIETWIRSRPGLGAPGRPKPSARKGVPGPRIPIEQRFWAKVNKTGPGECWLWTGAKTNGGYGFLSRGGRGAGNVLAHRWSYETHVGPIPYDLQIDHRCRTRACVNPAHLQAVDARTNLLRAPATVTSINSAKTHCNNGHPLSGDNLAIERGSRVCVTCRRARRQRADAKRSGTREGQP